MLVSLSISHNKSCVSGSTSDNSGLLWMDCTLSHSREFGDDTLDQSSLFGAGVVLFWLEVLWQHEISSGNAVLKVKI